MKKAPEALQADEESVKGPTRQDTINRLDAFEQEQRKAKPILMWEIALLAPIVLLYSAARGYMIVEVYVSLRDVPVGVYKTFEVAELIPHWYIILCA